MSRALLIFIALASSVAAQTLSGGAITDLVKSGQLGGGVLRDFWFDAPASPQGTLRVVAPASTETITSEDAAYRRDHGSTLATDYVWPYTIPPGRKTSETITRTSSAPGVIAPDPADESRWTWVSNGTATLTISCASRTVTANVTTSTQGAGTVDTLIGYASGSLRRAVVDSVAAALAGKSPATALRLYTTSDHTAPSYTRNSDAWVSAGVGSAIAAYNSTSGGAQRAGTLVSPRHVLFARHYPPEIGAAIRFVAPDNTIITRTLTATVSLTVLAGYYPDITIGLLDSDVPASISFAKVLPADWADYLPSQSALRAIPALTLDQEAKALISDLADIASDPTYIFTRFQRPADPAIAKWYEDKISGDSGQPGGLIIGSDFVLLTVWTFGGGGSGTSITHNKSAINAAMTTLGGGYQLTEINLSGFTKY